MKRLLCIVLIFAGLHLKAQQINLREVNAPLETVYKDIQKQTDYHFAGTTELLNKAQTVNVNLVNAPLDEALAQIFSDQPLSYTIYNKMVIIKDKEIPPIKEKVSPVDAVAQQTYSISGTVNDEKGEPLPGATVFLTGTKKVTGTDGSGKFLLGGISPGSYEIVVKMIGFTSDISVINIRDRPVVISVKLQPSNTELQAITITAAKPKNSTRDLKLFIDNFIGRDANARQCKILNPEVINLHAGPKGQYVLEATANDFIIIENDALGYKIKYLLKKFTYYYAYSICYYEGSPYFEELNGTVQQQTQWDNNRKLAYLGSARHFFRSAMNNTSRAEGFFTYEINNKQNRQNPSPLRLLNIDSMMTPANNNFKTLISKPHGAPRHDLYIYYTRTPADTYDVIWNQNQLTWVNQCVDTMTIDKNGSTTPGGYEFFNYRSGVDGKRGITPGVGFSFWGVWALQRVADLTPLDYFCTSLLNNNIFDNYHLMATDDWGQLNLSYYEPTGKNYVPVIKKTVFALGYNKKYIVAKQHPDNSKTITNYFILPTKRKYLPGDNFGLIGPMSATDFEQKRKELKLEKVDFSIVYKELE